jgi:hypothetical protein
MNKKNVFSKKKKTNDLEKSRLYLLIMVKNEVFFRKMFTNLLTYAIMHCKLLGKLMRIIPSIAVDF